MDESTKPLTDWDITSPDSDGNVWMNIAKEGGSFEMINLGPALEVAEKLGRWMASPPPAPPAP